MTESNRRETSILIITSMHRSGSSLTASLLQSAGLHIGRRLMEGAETNIKGHFENLDFWNFHQQVLKSQGVNEEGWTLQEKIEVETQYVEEAKKLVAKNAISSLWGWKEPRTTLFLEFWANLLPEANFLLVFRYPWEVVSSLYHQRKAYPIFQEQPELAIKFWLHYNQKILNFSNSFPQRCFLVSLNNFLQHTPPCIDALNQNFRINLSIPNPTIYEPSLLHRQDLEGHRASLINHYYPEAIALYQELEARAWQNADTPDTFWQEQLKSSPYRVWAFQDWLSVSNFDGENQKLQKELEEYKTQLQQKTKILEQTQAQLHETQEELERSQSQLHQTEAVLEQSISQLHETEAVLEQSISQLQQKTEELNQTQAQLHETQEELERSQSQLHYIQERTNYQKAIAGNSNGNIQTQYNLLIWDGWYAYLQGDFAKMSECLQKSVKYTSLSRTETILNWLETFGGFASSQNGRQLDIQQLINSREWQQLMRRVTTAKSLIATN